MSVRLLIMIVIVFPCLLANGCGNGHSPLETPMPQVPTELGSGLPSLEDLPSAQHQVALTGPGWLEIDPVDPSYWRAGSGTTAIPTSLTIEGNGAPGFALYAVGGFDGDNAPTSLRIHGLGYTGDYYVGFSCYDTGKWIYAGPFTGSVETAIPGTGDLPQPSAFIAPNGTTYFAIIAPQGNSLLITALSLGIDAGNEGPQPVIDFYGTGAMAGLHLSWLHSVSCQSPDFAGYQIERAPYTWGSFAPVATTGPLADYYIDTTVEIDTVYRYRIAAFDTNGNSSAWLTSICSTNSCWTDNPVAVLDVPAGPLYGPVDVTFDMTGCFDPGGGTINEYIVKTAADIELYNDSSPSFTCTLQPGCYTLKLRITTTDFREDTTVRFLKVYPRWRPDSVVVSYPEELYPRLSQLRAIVHPATGLLTWYAINQSLKGLSAWTRNPDGSFSHRSLPIFSEGTPQWIGEPVVIGSEVLIPVNMNSSINVARDDGTDFSWYGSGVNVCQGESIALGVDPRSNEVWLLFLREQPSGTFRPLLRSLTTNDMLQVSLTGTASTQVDMVWNPADSCFDIVHTQAVGTFWSRFEPGTGITRTEILGAATGMVDIEISPYTGQPAVLYFSGNRQRFRELDVSASVWCPEIILDNSIDNRAQADLLATGGSLFAMISRTGAAGELFEYDDTGWTMRNEVVFAASVPYAGAAIADMGAGEIALGVLDDHFTTRFTLLRPDGTRADIHTQLPLEGQGLSLTAASGETDIHVTWPSVGSVTHFTSPDAEVWSEQPELAGCILPALFGTREGKVYMSHQSGGQAHLSRWNGSGWDPLLSMNTNTATRPVTTAQPFHTSAHWGVYDDTVIPATFNWNYCGTVISTNTYYPDEAIWAGSVNNDSVYNVFCLYGDSSISDASTGLYSISTNHFIPLYKNPYHHNDDTYTAGRTLDSSSYHIRGGHFPQPVFWASYGPEYAPVRIELDQQGIMSLTELPFVMDWEHADWRRTVSAIYTHGGSAAGLVCSATGNQTWFEWDDFGNWEDLPLPDNMGPMALPELVKSLDGRWHIIYRDATTDTIRCRSTL